MRYLSPDQLPALTQAADTIQSALDRAIADFNALSTADTTFDFRLTTLDRLTTILYRLAGVRKTLAALRAGFTYNLDALQQLNDTLRSLHINVQNLHGEFRTPGMPNLMPNLAPKRFSKELPPYPDELIPEPELPHQLSGVPTPPPPDQNANGASAREAAFAHLASFYTSPAQHGCTDTTNQLDPQALSTALLNRIPASITNPNHKLPTDSNTPTDYAPLHNLDLLAKTPTIPTLPINQNLPKTFDKRLSQLTNQTITTHADIIQHEPPTPPPSPSHQSNQSNPSVPSVLSVPLDPSDPSKPPPPNTS